MSLTGKTISQLTLLETPTVDTLIPVELSGETYHIEFSAITSYTEVTYNELYSAYTGGTLTPGKFYLISDFQTCYDQPDFNQNGNEIIGNNYKTGTTEQIVVLATSVNSLSPKVYSLEYPLDDISYDITFTVTERTGNPAKGRITERIDERGNRTDYDFRSVLFKRYDFYYSENYYNGTLSIDGNGVVTGVDTLFSDNFNVGDILGVYEGSYNNPSGCFKYYEILTISGSTGMTVTGNTILSYNNTPYSRGIQFNNYRSFHQTNIISNTAYTEYFTFQATNVFNVKIGNYANLYDWQGNSFLLSNNVFLGGSYRDIIIGDESYDNTFDDDMNALSIGNNCYRNIITNDFDENTVGNYFSSNIIICDMQDNQIGNFFQYNMLGDNDGYDFDQNRIGNYFEANFITFANNDFLNNDIGDSFYNNLIDHGFQNNYITGNFYSNKIDGSFNDNKVGNNFNNNDIYSQFSNNVIGESYNDNTVGDTNSPGNTIFSENNIGTDFEGNVITQDFRKNEIGYGFYNNNISGNTNTNRIGEQFENNTIYGDFYDNQIFNDFKGNITYQDFYENRVDWRFDANQISGSCSDNAFGPTIVSNDFLGVVFGNIFKGAVYENTIGDNFAANNIGFGFGYNTIGEGFGYGAGEPQGNIIGNGFIDNIIGEYFYNNSIPDNFHDNEIGNYFQWNVINTNIDNTYFTLNYGNITGFSYTAAGTGATDTIYTNLTGTTNGHGVGATFDVEVSGGTVIGVSGNTEGRLYIDNDELTILGTQIGGVIGVIDGFSSDAVGKSGTTGSYTGITASGTGGENATFDIDVAGDLVTDIYLNNGGEGYSVSETLTILGSDFGGIDGVDDITITVTSVYSDDIVITVTGTTSGSSFYQHYTKQIFERRLGDKRVSFYDEDDILNVDSVYEISGYIPVYSQPISFPLNNPAFEFQCDGSYTNNGGDVGLLAVNTQEVVRLFNISFRTPGVVLSSSYFFDNNDGTIGVYINPLLKQQYCPSGTYTINVFNN